MTSSGATPKAPDGRRILLLIGAVGAGKGTQADMLARELGLVHLASGNLFRRALQEGTELGEKAREYMEQGDLVPDEITIAMFMDELARPVAARGAILDGFPRTVAQAEALDATLAQQGEAIEHAIHIDVPTEELVERVSGRWVCPTCGTPYHARTDPPRQAGVCDKDGTPLRQRDDDRPEVVRARLAKQTPPMLQVIDHYRAAGNLLVVDGRGSVGDVGRVILEAVR